MGEEALRDTATRLAEMIVRSRRLVVFTGAGVSTESGIPDFRSPGGIWERYTPVEHHEFLTSPEARQRYWERSRATYPVVRAAQPNPAHYSIARLYELGKLDCVITQNIDELHQRAGVPKDRVIELHGTARWVKCLQCGHRYDRDEIQIRLEAGELPPSCKKCGGILKSATISFGEPMPELETVEAQRRSLACDLFIVIGSSLVVYPAAYMPLYALQAGARMAILNVAETPFDEHAQLVARARAGEFMPMVLERLQELVDVRGRVN